ncbi:MAG: DUF4350 domain-containing protein [Polyangiaceae bacterium]
MGRAVRVARAMWTALVVAGVLSFAGIALGAPFDLSGNDWEGCGALVQLAKSDLGARRVIATSQIDFQQLRPDDGLVLLYPEKNLDVDALTKFMHAGGRVILLDDFGRGEGLLRHFGMRRVPLPKQPIESLRKNPQLALAEPASAHPVVLEVGRVVTNHATGLAHPDLSPVLKIRAQGEPDVYVAVAGAVGRGRLLAVGDPSIVMNSMLRYSGNKAFARALLKYAVDQDTWGKRGGRLFLASGAFDQKGTFGDDDSTLADALHALRDAISTARREGLPPSIAYAAAIAVGLALVVWVGARAGKLHRPMSPRFARRTPTVAQGGLAGHAAVLAAPQTSRVLAVLELKAALEEELCALLGLEKTPAHDRLLAEIAEKSVLDAEGLHTLRRLLLRMSTVETMVVFQRSGGMAQGVRDAEVLSIASTVQAVLGAARARVGAKERA